MSYNPLVFPTFALAATLFVSGFALGRRFHFHLIMALVGIILAVPGLLCVFYYTHLFNQAIWFYRFRAEPWTELTIAGLGFLPGLLYSWWEPETIGEKLVLPALTFLLVFVPFCKPILDPLNSAQLKDKCDGEVCMQSTFSTCGPSSAATVMKKLGQAASEKELAVAAYSSRIGTEVWYLARALRRRGFQAQIVSADPHTQNLPTPSIAGVVLPGGAGHFIAVLEDSGPEVTLADPLKGKLVIPRSELTHTYHFTGLFLVVRKNTSPN